MDAAATLAQTPSPFTWASAGTASCGGTRLPSTTAKAGAGSRAATARSMPAMVAQRMFFSSISWGLTNTI